MELRQAGATARALLIALGVGLIVAVMAEAPRPARTGQPGGVPVELLDIEDYSLGEIFEGGAIPMGEHIR